MIENLVGQGKSLFSWRTVFPFPVKIVRVSLAMLTMHMAEQGIEHIVLFYLRPEERGRFLAFRHEKRKVEWLAGRIAAKCAALQLAGNAEKTEWDAGQWQHLLIAADKAGKPYVVWETGERATQVCISISHSRGYALAGAAREDCGVDIQQVTPAVERVAERFVGRDDTNILGELSTRFGQRAALTLLWSAKEAVKKTAAGSGLPGFLDIRLHSVQTEGDELLFTATVRQKEGDAEGNQLVWATLFDGFSYAVTMQEGGRR